MATTTTGGWAGFQGNTVFDWLQLFVAPLVLPVILIPLIGSWMVADVVEAQPANVAPAGTAEPTQVGPEI